MLSKALVFQLFRDETTTGTVTTPPIIITLHSITYCFPHHFPTDKAFAVDALDIQRVEDASRKGIILTAAFYTHAAAQVIF